MAVQKITADFYDIKDVEWPCPNCHQQTLQIIPETFIEKETHQTKNIYGEDWFEPEMIELIFSCMAQCARAKCGEVVACSGVGRVEQDYDPESGVGYYKAYRPVSFVPPLHPIEITENCPDEIEEPLIGSFSVYLSQPGSAANLIRIAVERLLTAIGVPETRDNGKRIWLGNRLERLSGPYEEYKDLLKAIKFLGNAGSHTHDSVAVPDIEDAFEIMGHVTNDLFSGRKESLVVLTERLSNKFKDE
ncbi:DUF4145 domain-containing protein [Franconibacter daqui]|uniref:DUF4145 domain-containing protein n=1 Tax=Franconibacter daqui TaxID=2047724 RepID=UPI002DB73A5A|nr:DUF4145 domain-containing protein [Franconibacter daqui]MEB5924749.1 DUF4145 domain-containing protein [Franconibacter daqui]